MNLIRVHSLDFFDPFLPRPRGGPAPWIPYENLGHDRACRGPARFGREVYGAGEGIWAYLLFEALARADDPAILVVYTDLLEPATMRAFPPPRRRFLVYNPTRERRAFSLAHRHLTGASYRLSTSDRAVDPNTLLGGVPVALEPRSFLVVDVEEIP